MKSDDIYKVIGYAVVIVFVFYVVSKSLRFQTKIIEGLTSIVGDDEDKEDKKLSAQEKRELDRQTAEEEKKREKEDKNNSKSINTIIKNLRITNNENLKDFKKTKKNTIKQYNSLIDNYIQREKINIFYIIYNKNANITFVSIIDDIREKYDLIESLKKSAIYLSDTTSGVLVEDVKGDDNSIGFGGGGGGGGSSTTNTSTTTKTESDKKDEEGDIEDELKKTNKLESKFNNEDIKFISKTDKELIDSYFDLITCYITEEKIYISDLLLSIGEDPPTYESNMNTIEYRTKNITVLENVEIYLNELFSGGVSKSSSNKKAIL